MWPHRVRKNEMVDGQLTRRKAKASQVVGGAVKFVCPVLHSQKFGSATSTGPTKKRVFQPVQQRTIVLPDLLKQPTRQTWGR